MKIIYQRIYLTTLPFKGHFRYRDKFQLIEVPTEVTSCPYTEGHHPVLLQYSFDYQEDFTPSSDLPPHVHQDKFGDDVERELVIIIQLLLSGQIVNYDRKQQWFISHNDYKCHWGHSEYNAEVEPAIKKDIGKFWSAENYAHLKRTNTSEFYNRKLRIMTDSLLDAPEDIEELLDDYFSLTRADQETLITSSYLLQKCLDTLHSSPSLATVALVNCVENILSYEAKEAANETSKCPTCNKTQDSITKRFKQFIREYGAGTKNLQEFAYDLYRLRSNIVHGGQLFRDELFGHKMGAPIDREFDRIKASSRIVRICLLNWMLSRRRKG